MSYKILLEQYAKAVLEKEVEGFMAIYDPIVNVYDTWNSWIKKDIEEIRSMATEWFKSLGEEKVRVEFTEVNVLESVFVNIVVAFSLLPFTLLCN